MLELIEYCDSYAAGTICHHQVNTYHIRTNIGEELNLANWQITTQLPSLNLANIFSIGYQL